MKTKKRLRTIVRRLIAMLIAVVMCITSGDGMGRVYAQTVEVGRPDSSELVRYLTLSVKDVTTGEVIVENGTPTGNRVNENDDVKIMFIKDECERLKTDNKHMMTVQDAIKWLEAKKVR